MSSEGQRPAAVAGWLSVLLCVAGFTAVAWQGFGLALLVRVIAGAMVAIIILLQPALAHFGRGGVFHGTVTLVASFAVMLGGYRLVPAALRLAAAPEPAADEAPPPEASAAPLLYPSPGAEPESEDLYANLPNAKRYDCAALVFPNRTITKYADGFSPENWRPRLLKTLEARYPDAASVVDRLAEPTLFDVWFRQGKGDWSQAMLELSTGVHEASHMVDISARRGKQHVLVLSQKTELCFPIPKTFHRSVIAETLPPAIKALSYTQTYLTGASGAQGFEMVLEEQNAYTYSVLTGVAVVDQLPGNMSTSTRDGLMVFIYYVEAYLRLARTLRPDNYGAITGSKALRNAVIQLNDRAECALSLTAGHDNLGIADQEIWPHVFGEQALGEVARLRASAAQ